MPELRDFSSGAPRIREHFIRQNPSVVVAACKADPAGILKDAVAAMGEIADASAQREQHAGKERHLDRAIATSSAAAAAAEAAASTQSLDTCKRTVTEACVDAAVARFIYATGTPFWVVVAIRN
jgi:hypothetical protein